jgi:hypothetical protein
MKYLFQIHAPEDQPDDRGVIKRAEGKKYWGWIERPGRGAVLGLEGRGKGGKGVIVYT